MAFTPNGIEARKAGSPEITVILSAVGVYPIAAKDITRSLSNDGISTGDVTQFGTRGGAGGLVTPFDIPPDGFDIELSLAPNSEGRLLMDAYATATRAYAGNALTSTFLSLTIENKTTQMRTQYIMGGIATTQSGDPMTREDGQGNKVYNLRFCYCTTLPM